MSSPKNRNIKSGKTEPGDVRKSSANELLKYSGMAFQMAFCLIVGWWLGHWLDKYAGTPKPYFAIALSVLFLAAYFVKLIRDISKK